MSPDVLALGAAVLTAAGSVWYLPALLDLRAGPDRPLSLRIAAVSCLILWSTPAALAVLLLLAVPWPALATTAATGIAASATVRIAAACRRFREQREEDERWAALHLGHPPGRHPGRFRGAFRGRLI
ncbi:MULTISPECIES: hypothetical protein [Streptomyces]|uniref:Uncharacterized protein n=1 Tax=Streptomyces rimosus subsp. rimosus TaxID=132474 RepID=A0ABY3Z276_STRRM|nr:MULTISPECIES: hypothetical protein [Streptomyces]KEF02139.1 hypothetical protein DF17_35215 [Streptomyces rimosus]UNZ04060.1 hypothetical protein SRIMR7_18025 [Streptomyces rimosus subsp. rimosus]UTH95567.1 hypothetical protein SRIMHP_15660 [Streptomyces rimosus subsp. rimosus]UTJ13663.1 hypothetical protein SRIMDV3_15555 [Streptomyces rimosus subsp. rimosus]